MKILYLVPPHVFFRIICRFIRVDYTIRGVTLGASQKESQSMSYAPLSFAFSVFNHEGEKDKVYFAQKRQSITYGLGLTVSLD